MAPQMSEQQVLQALDKLSSQGEKKPCVNLSGAWAAWTE